MPGCAPVCAGCGLELRTRSGTNKRRAYPADSTKGARLCFKPAAVGHGVVVCVNPNLVSSLAFRVSGPRPRTRNPKSSLDEHQP